jgi:membrane fusion protein (multidrug efflux system)
MAEEGQAGGAGGNGSPANGTGNGAAAPRRAWRRYVVILVVLVAGGLYGWHWWQEAQLYETTDDATFEGDVIPITSEISGRVKAVNFEDNDKVQPGQVLVELDDTPYQIALQQAQAKLAVDQQQAEASKTQIDLAASQAKAQRTTASGSVSNAGAGVASAEAQVKQAEEAAKSSAAKLDQAKTAAGLAQSQYQRFKDLADKGYVTAQELDTQRAALDTAKAQVAAAEKDVSQAEARVKQAKAGVAQAQAGQVQSAGQVESAKAAAVQIDVAKAQYAKDAAQIQSSQADVAEAQLHLTQTKIMAPFPGRMGEKAVAPGMEISPGQQLGALVSPRLWVVANYKETQVRRLALGQAVDVTIDALPGVVLHGKVDSFSPASGAEFALLPPENATGNFTKVVQRIPVKITFDNSELEPYTDKLTPGLSVITKVRVK